MYLQEYSLFKFVLLMAGTLLSGEGYGRYDSSLGQRP